MTTLLGFDVTNVPTADLMELAAQLLEIDQRTIMGLAGCLTTLGANLPETPAAVKDTTPKLAALLRERAPVVRALEEMTARAGRLDS